MVVPISSSLVAALMVLTAWQSPARSAGPEPGPQWVATDEAVTILPYVTLNASGLFRFRTDLFVNGALGSGMPGFYHEYSLNTATLRSNILQGVCTTDTATGQRSCTKTDTTDTSAGANLMFRFHPVLTIGERVNVHAEFEILPNLVLGTTPDVHPYYNNGLAFLSGGQQVPQSGLNSWRDAIRVRRLWADFTFLDRVLIRAGRMPDQWGLGIVRNSGDDLDNDFGNAADRIEGAVRIYNFYVGFAWDFAVQSPISDTAAQPFGQPHDLLELDDVQQYVVKLFYEPQFKDEKEARQKVLDRGGLGFDWGLYNAFRIQKFSSEFQNIDMGTTTDCQPADGNDLSRSWQCLVTTPRKAFFWTPDLWLRFVWSPTLGERFRIEFESALVYGYLNLVDYDTRKNLSRHFLQWGMALEFEYQRWNWRFGGNAGIAGLPTGDDPDGKFGVLDGPTYSPEPTVNQSNEDEQKWDTQSPSYRQQDVHLFQFNRGYNIDHLLFREIIGTVTNAWYIKPWVEWNFWRKADHRLTSRFDLMYAGAMDRRGTPGNALGLGLELDAALQYALGTHFDARLETALLIPFDGLRRLTPESKDPVPAFTLQMNMYWHF